MTGIGKITITKLLVVVTISSCVILTGLLATIVLIMVVQSLTPIQIVQYLTEVLSGRILVWSVVFSSWLMLVAGLLTIVVTVCRSASALIRRYKVGLIRVTTDARNSQADPSPPTSDDPQPLRSRELPQVERTPENFYLARRWFETVENMMGWKYPLGAIIILAFFSWYFWTPD